MQQTKPRHIRARRGTLRSSTVTFGSRMVRLGKTSNVTAAQFVSYTDI